MSEENEQQEESSDLPDLMNDLSEAWDLSETGAEEAPESPPEAPETVLADTQPETQNEQKTASEDQESGQEAAPAGDSPPDDTPTTAPPAVREAWASLPDGVKAAWGEREQQFQTKLQESAEAANYARQLGQVMQPHIGALQMEAGGPVQAIGNMAQAISVLRQGTPQEKANFAAGIIKNYGVDIAALDQALVNGGGQDAPPPAAAPIDPRIDRIEQHLKQQQQGNNARQAQAANREIQNFEQNGGEFLNDVRIDMADMMDMYTARGQTITIQEAYDKACAMNPAVQEVLTQRALTSSETNREGKRNAASSISGAPSGNGVAPAGTLRGALEQAWGDS